MYDNNFKKVFNSKKIKNTDYDNRQVTSLDHIENLIIRMLKINKQDKFRYLFTHVAWVTILYQFGRWHFIYRPQMLIQSLPKARCNA